MSIEEKLHAFATGGAGGVIWVLLALGIIVVSIAIERALVLLRTHEDTARLQVTLRTALGQGDLLAARTCVVASRSIEARVIAAGLGALPRGASSVEERMASEVQLTRLALERRLSILRAVASSAPFVGLLGTLIGMIRALQLLDTTGCGASALSAEIAAALAITAFGLVVALPAVLLTHFFQCQVASRMTRAEALGREMLSYIKDERRSFGERAWTEARTGTP